MKVVHGTTKEGLDAIKNKTGKISGLWECSTTDSYTYVWPFDKVAKEYDCDNENETRERAIQLAFESAQVQAVNSDFDKIYVLELEIPDELLENDESCENMQMASCFDSVCWDDVTIINIYENDFNMFYKPFIVCNLLNNDYFTWYDLDEKLVILAKALQGKDIFIDELYEFDYRII